MNDTHTVTVEVRKREGLTEPFAYRFVMVERMNGSFVKAATLAASDAPDAYALAAGYAETYGAVMV